MLRARALEQALRMLIDAAVQTACKIAEDGDRRWHVVDLVCATNDAEKLLAVDPPPSGASPQATGGYIHHSVTDWIPTPECDCDRCTSARKSAPKPTGGASPQAETSGFHCSECGGVINAGEFQVFGVCDACWDKTHMPAPVSPVEPESSSFEANTASNLLQKVELSTLDRYRNTNQMDVDTWMVRAVASSEPRSEDDLVLLDHVIALLKPTVEPEPPTKARCPNCGSSDVGEDGHETNGPAGWQGTGDSVCAVCEHVWKPTVETEPCVWREVGLFLVRPLLHPGERDHDKNRVKRYKCCPYCGAPLKVEQ